MSAQKSKEDGGIGGASKGGFKTKGGRIAQVLADARQETLSATLKEPSRPYTPATYDSKTSIDISDQYKFAEPLLNMRGPTQNKSLRSLEKSSLDSSVSTGGKLGRGSQQTLSSMSSFGSDATVQLLVYDISDAVNAMEVLIDRPDGRLQENLVLQLTNFGSNVDSLNRLMRDGSKFQIDVMGIVSDVCTSLIRIASGQNDSLAKCLASKYLIQLQLLSLQRDDNRVSILAIRQCCRIIYESLTHDGSSNKSSIALATSVDQLTLLLSVLWTQFPNAFNALMNGTSPDSLSTSENFDILLESGLFSVGIIRHYSGPESSRKRLIYLGLVDSLSQGLHIITSSYYQYFRDRQKLKKESNHSPLQLAILSLIPKILSQITATLRNFSLDAPGRALLLNAKVIGPLCQILLLYKHEPDLQLNVLRVTAKLSLLEPFRALINAKPSNVKCLSDVIISEAVASVSVIESSARDKALKKAGIETTEPWPRWQTWPILSRVAFTLGNLTTSNNQNRILIGMECKCLKPLVTLLQASAKLLSSTENSVGEVCAKVSSSSDRRSDSFSANERDDDSDSCGSEDKEDTDQASTGVGPQAVLDTKQEIVDAVVKLLRLLANLSIDGDVGRYIASRVEPFQALLELMQRADKYDELLLNAVATATNITYYACHAEKISDQLEHVLLQLALQLSKSLFHHNDEVVLETARALGNVTRLSSALPALLSKRVDEALLLLLQHPNQEIVAVVTGALVNLTRNQSARDSLILLGISATVEPLTTVLRRSSLKNLQLSTLVCQVLHNMLSTMHDSERTSSSLISPPKAVAALFSQQRADFLRSIPEILVSSLTELVDCASDLAADSDENEFAEFISVGTQVLQIVNAYQ